MVPKFSKSVIHIAMTTPRPAIARAVTKVATNVASTYKGLRATEAKGAKIRMIRAWTVELEAPPRHLQITSVNRGVGATCTSFRKPKPRSYTNETAHGR